MKKLKISLFYTSLAVFNFISSQPTWASLIHILDEAIFPREEDPQFVSLRSAVRKNKISYEAEKELRHLINKKEWKEKCDVRGNIKSNDPRLEQIEIFSIQPDPYEAYKVVNYTEIRTWKPSHDEYYFLSNTTVNPWIKDKEKILRFEQSIFNINKLVYKEKLPIGSKLEDYTVEDDRLTKDIYITSNNAFTVWVPLRKEYKKSIERGPRGSSVTDDFKFSIELFHDKGIVKANNDCGGIVYNINFLLNSFIDSVKKENYILDIGTGTGANIYQALKKGAVCTANDTWLPHLATLNAFVKLCWRERLTLNNYIFPTKTNFEERRFDTVLISHVLHYLSDKEVEQALNKLYKWLKPGGKAFIQAMSPYAPSYFWRLRKTEALWEAGEEWPGYISDIVEELSGQLKIPQDIIIDKVTKFNIPNYGHGFYPETLEKKLQEKGFIVTYINYGNLSALQPPPLRYQEIEKYIKAPFPSSILEEEEKRLIISKLHSYPDFKKELDASRVFYQNYTSPSSIEEINFNKGLRPFQLVQTIILKP